MGRGLRGAHPGLGGSCSGGLCPTGMVTDLSEPLSSQQTEKLKSDTLLTTSLSASGALNKHVRHVGARETKAPQQPGARGAAEGRCAPFTTRGHPEGR